MIFKEETSSTNELILPPIVTSSKSEIPVQNNSQEEIVENINQELNKEPETNEDEVKNQEKNTQSSINNKNIHNNNLTVEVNKVENNRYNLQESRQTIQDENSKIINEEENKKSQEKSKTIPTIKSLTNNDNQYIARVILENIRSLKDCIFLLENYLKSNNIQTYYETKTEQDKIIFMFAEEKIAFEFTKIIYNEKNKNYLYKNVKVNFSLEPNETYLKRERIKNRKRGLSYESIMQLYRGSSYVKKDKEFPKIIGNTKLGLKSPFYVVSLNKKKKKFNTSKKLTFDRKSLNIINTEVYLGYDGNPLKNYEKLKINVLDTHYNPFSNVKYRDENKNKWFSPKNFKCY
jgi:hypothetical protein